MSAFADLLRVTGEAHSVSPCQPYVRNHAFIGEPGERAIAYLRVDCPGCGTHSVPIGDRCVGDVRSWQRSRSEFACRRCERITSAAVLTVHVM